MLVLLYNYYILYIFKITIFKLFNSQGNEKLYYQLLDLELARTPVSEEKVDEVFSMVEKSDSLSEDTKRLFQNRRVQFLEEFSSDIYKLVLY